MVFLMKAQYLSLFRLLLRIKNIAIYVVVGEMKQVQKCIVMETIGILIGDQIQNQIQRQLISQLGYKVYTDLSLINQIFPQFITLKLETKAIRMLLKKNEVKRESQIPSRNLLQNKLRPVSVGTKKKITLQSKMKQNKQSKFNPTNNGHNSWKVCEQKIQKAGYFSKYLSDGNIMNNLNVLSHIGKGSFSIVELAIEKKSERILAIKTYEKIDMLHWDRLGNIKKEIENLRKINNDTTKNQNIIKLIDVVKDRKKLLLIMQNGGKHSLAGILRKSKKIKEEEVKKYFKQILSGLKHCHDNGICHRDLKLQNILINDEGQIKIIDFGFSTNSKAKLNDFCGTPPYMCPQIVKKIQYNGAAADIWSLGVIFYLMLFGTFPFRATNQKQLYRLIQQGKYQIKTQDDELVSGSAKVFLMKMLNTNEKQRITATQLLNQKWINQ